jgi:large subunit ribosomal protein L23
MKTARDIIIKPIITEASVSGLASRKYTFAVAKDATKIDIKRACEEIFKGVEVEKVNVVNCKGKFKRMGRSEGYRPDWKKAVVTVTEKSKTIEFFDNLA